jgi:hypothetical protein
MAIEKLMELTKFEQEFYELHYKNMYEGYRKVIKENYNINICECTYINILKENDAFSPMNNHTVANIKKWFQYIGIEYKYI